MRNPYIIVRFDELSKYLPIGPTARDELISLGLLKVVPLTPKGRAKGITLNSIVQYQRDVMGLEASSNDIREIGTGGFDDTNK
jgi:hypothetical protein